MAAVPNPPVRLEEAPAWLSAPIATLRAERARAIVVGIGGGQGAGKTTLAGRIGASLEDDFGLRAVALSLDDFYLTAAERERLAGHVHPELRTRGPGTHDVALAAATVRALRDAASGREVRYPRFDKARDDRVPGDQWPSATGPNDVVLLEGVLIGAEPQDDAALLTPINTFERERDPDGKLRRHVNAQLAALHAALGPLLDWLVFLAVPDMAHVLAWRIDQERALGPGADGRPRGMDPAQIARFVARFERVTLHMLATVPARADALLELADDHALRSVRVREPG